MFLVSCLETCSWSLSVITGSSLNSWCTGPGSFLDRVQSIVLFGFQLCWPVLGTTLCHSLVVLTTVMWVLLLVLLTVIYLFRWNRNKQILPNLTDKYVLITGCDSGFGNLAAKQLDKRGLHVLAACLSQRGAESLKKETSNRLKTVILDVTDSQSVSSAAKWVAGIVGDKGLWGVVNNAGVAVPTAPNEWLNKEDFSKILNVNLLGVVDVTLKMLPLIRKARGRVVNVASIAGRLTICGGGYCMSKYGVESFSDSIRRELARFGVKVCIIEPGFFMTQMTDAKLMKENLKNTWTRLPEEIRRSYGLAYYEKFCRTTDHSFSTSSSKLHLVSDSMEHALTAVYPKTRYSAGWDAKLLYLPLSYLPTAITDFLFSIVLPTPAQSA
ncbi:retinol dehydrogenase 16-like isoform X1 [Pseudophryne corroboree]|uniref:retinol dehydrogenase 16-like isoform X1 n=2 Tax=Pseudophryne corroboree TaxID=495146 RepID=UPI003081F0C8